MSVCDCLWKSCAQTRLRRSASCCFSLQIKRMLKGWSPGASDAESERFLQPKINSVNKIDIFLNYFFKYQKLRFPKRNINSWVILGLEKENTRQKYIFVRKNKARELRSEQWVEGWGMKKILRIQSQIIFIASLRPGRGEQAHLPRCRSLNTPHWLSECSTE